MITSTANEKVKFVKKLHDKKNRDAENLFIAEGVNILSDLKEGFSVKEIFATDKTADIAENLAKKYGACTTLVSESVMKVLADTVSPSGILAVIEIPLSKPGGVNADVLYTRKPVLLAYNAVPRRVCKVSYGTAHDTEIIMLFAVCVCIYKTLCKKTEIGAYWWSFIRIFRLLNVQCVLQPFPRGYGRIPSYADCA